MHYDIILVGDYCYDLIFTDLARLPELGHEINAGSFDHVPGGPFIQAVTLTRLGVRVGWAADFGNDLFSQTVIAAARDEGVDDALFQHHPRPYRRVTAAASLPRDRAFLSYAGDPEPEPSAALIALQTHEAHALMIPGLLCGLRFDPWRELARARGMKIVMGCHSMSETLDDPPVRCAIERADVFLPNSPEAQHLTETRTTLDALRVLRELCPLVVIKDGPDGAHAMERGNGRYHHQPAIPVSVVDTTGAGDAFDAGFVAAWLDRKPIDECLRWGNICGGLSTTARGGATAVPTRAQVRAWLARLGQAAGD